MPARRTRASLAAAVCLLLLHSCACDQKPVPRVIVIGAGLAGIAAGRDLADNQIGSLVLEARSRPGGRLYSVDTAAGRMGTLAAACRPPARLLAAFRKDCHLVCCSRLT